jgi:hypothetical protein
MERQRSPSPKKSSTLKGKKKGKKKLSKKQKLALGKLINKWSNSLIYDGSKSRSRKKKKRRAR